MRNLLLILPSLILAAPVAYAEDEKPIRPTVLGLVFLIGQWEVTFEWYDTHNPKRGVVFTEEGTQTCEFDLALNGVPMFITCRGELRSDRGRVRTIHESIRYNRFAQAFERIGKYSNWPSSGKELAYYHSKTRILELKGELDVQNGILERYEDFYHFDEAFTSYTREQIGNFSDMPVSQFNVTLKGTGTKIN